jgi:hypothetical protein
VELATWLGNSSVAAEFEQHREFGTAENKRRSLSSTFFFLENRTNLLRQARD